LAETYVAASKATLRNSLYDPYVRAIRWASDRIGSEGVVAFVTNNSFLDGIAFDGMRYHLSRDFSTIYHINLRGNARTSGEKRRKEAGNIFDDQIRVSVGITFCIRKPKDQNKLADVFVFSIDDYLSSLAKSDLLQGFGSLSQVPFQKIEMNPAYVWLTAGLQDDYQNFISLGSKEAKRDRVSNVVFSTFSRGLLSNRDAWVYNFNITDLACNMEKTIEFYNAELDRYKRKKTEEVQLDNFLNYDESKISWGRVLKNGLKQKKEATFLAENIRMSLYRPFTKTFLFFDRLWNQDIYLIPIIFPNTQTEKENCIICVPGLGGRTNFWCLASNQITNLSLISIDANQCFPFYTYDESGNNRQENITDWALAEYRQHYQNEQISKWDIFYYIYGVLHHPQYRERYAANLRRELPRIPYLQDFRTISTIGRKLADLHVNYEELSGYELEKVENPDVTLNWQVEKMRLTKDRQSIIYNDFLTLAGIPSEVFEYKLGNRSALEWVIEEYQVSKDKRSGIINDPNRYDDPQYIVRLVEQVVAVSVATVQLVKSLPVFEVKNV
jgi:predicted helicase